MQIIRCTLAQLDALAPLFDDYRVFYQEASSPPACQDFLRRNLVEGRSRLYLAQTGAGLPAGFCQVYPAITSIGMNTYWYLSDLYVRPDLRNSGYARGLLQEVAADARREGIARISLETARTNLGAQRLYESQGYRLEETFLMYHLVV